MSPKKTLKEQKTPADKINRPPEATKKIEPVNPSPKKNLETEKGKNHGKIKKTETESKPKPVNKKVAGAESQNVKWILEDGKYYKAKGNKVTLVDDKFSTFEYAALAILIQDGAAPVSGEHFWTAHFGGTESYKFFGITNPRWLKEQYGLLYSGVLSKFQGWPKAEFGPLIKSGDVIGVLCSFSESEGHLNLYFYHNGRCLGLSFQVPASLFLPEGIRPCVKMDEVGAWATITKEPKENIPKKKDRVRISVAQFGVEGNWNYRTLIDSTTGNVIPLNVDGKKKVGGQLTIEGNEFDSLWTIQLGMSHNVKFTAEKKKNNLWKKTRSLHDRHGRGGPIVLDHTAFWDFPIVDTISDPEKIVLQDQQMWVTKGEMTVIFDKIYKMKKGNVFKQELVD